MFFFRCFRKHTTTFTLYRREFAIIDLETRELRSHIQEILEAVRSCSKSRSSRMHQSVVETGTEICPSIVMRARELICAAGSRSSRERIKIASVGTHPFSTLRSTHHHERYKRQRHAVACPRQSDFGLRTSAFQSRCRITMNQARYFLPHITRSRSTRRFGLARMGLKAIDSKCSSVFRALEFVTRLKAFKRRLLQAVGQNWLHR